MDRTALAAALAVLTALCAVAPVNSEAQTRDLPTVDESFEYVFGPADVIHVQVWGNAELTGTATIGPTGRVLLPLVGEIQAAGSTPEQLSNTLTDRYQLLDSSITEVLVSISQYKSRSVTVVGEVRDPGTFGFQTIPDLWTVILTAGGPTKEAELARVQVVRQAPAAGEPRTITVDLSRGIDGTPAESLPELRPSDKVLVPSSEDAPGGSDRIQILGAVREPGIYRTSAAGTVVEALALAGGPLPTAQLDRIFVTRLTSAGAVSYRLDLEDFLYQGENSANLALQAGDTIMVREKSGLWSKFSEGLGRLAPFASLVVTVLLATN